MVQNFLITTQHCPFCKKLLGIVEEINMYLPLKDRVRNVDATMLEEFDIDLNPILKRLKWEGTPTLYLNGIVYEGFSSRDNFRGFLKSYFGLGG